MLSVYRDRNPIIVVDQTPSASFKTITTTKTTAVSVSADVVAESKVNGVNPTMPSSATLRATSDASTSTEASVSLDLSTKAKLDLPHVISAVTKTPNRCLLRRRGQHRGDSWSDARMCALPSPWSHRKACTQFAREMGKRFKYSSAGVAVTSRRMSPCDHSPSMFEKVKSLKLTAPLIYPIPASSDLLNCRQTMWRVRRSLSLPI
ncbi:hypothetical protein BGX33_000811 [Mortierella sp. NVP41]|nr:hypothetical protein BGX33_000811 [Mortierella sp. NVP41]